jgi:hypothetical protein
MDFTSYVQRGPIPMIPNEILSLADVAPSRPRTCEGIYVAAAAVAAKPVVRKSRRVLADLFIFRLLFIEDSSAEQFARSNAAVNHETCKIGQVIPHLHFGWPRLLACNKSTCNKTLLMRTVASPASHTGWRTIREGMPPNKSDWAF